MNAEERRNQLLEMVRRRGFAALPDLAEELQVSESTVRRDLDHLDEQGETRRTHGGVYYAGPTPKLPHFEQRQAAQLEQKKAIARSASELIEDGDTLLLDGGSTTYELAKHLVGRPLQVVTNSLPVANLFIAGSSTDLILVGGYVHPRTGVLLGPYADHMLSSLNVRRSVLSVAGVSDRGCFNSNLLLVETERVMMQAADEVIVLADSTKFGHQSLAHLCELSAVDRMVIDHGISEDWRSKLVAAGIDVIIAGPTDNG
ncbi:MAG: DeoR/GlpR family DNA-binding transcription regulator [Pirellulales bacterium]